MKQSQRRRIERLQGTLMKLVAQLESCKLIMDDIQNMREE
jgi:hypothetical protein